jgi:hypothetical protein
MSVIVKGGLARYRAVQRDGDRSWLMECPGCGTWANLDNDQWLGLVSVDHAADGCTGGYHETHNYAADLEAHIDEAQTS